MANPIDLKPLQGRLVAIAADSGAAFGAFRELRESLVRLGDWIDTPGGARMLTPSDIAAIEDIGPRLESFSELVTALRDAAVSVAQASKEIEARIPKAN